MMILAESIRTAGAHSGRGGRALPLSLPLSEGKKERSNRPEGGQHG